MLGTGVIGGQARADSYPLYAGQDEPVGSVVVTESGGQLHVAFELDAGYVMTESHVAVADSPDGIPNANGNPRPGQFAYKQTHTPPVTAFTYDIEDYPFGEIVVAAHAVVVAEDDIVAAPYYADWVVHVDQGPTKDGGSVLPNRSNPEAGLEPGGAFWSFGFGGTIEAEFDCPIVNRDGTDLSIREITNGTYPREVVRVFARKKAKDPWTDLGDATNGRTIQGSGGSSATVSEFDLGDLTSARFIRLEDDTDSSAFDNYPNADAFDLDGIGSLQGCYDSETAWGAGGGEFAGKNWATYISYETAPLP